MPSQVAHSGRGIARRTAVVAAQTAAAAGAMARAAGPGPTRRRALTAASVLLVGILALGGFVGRRPLPTAEVAATSEPGHEVAPSSSAPTSGLATRSFGGAPLPDRWVPCAFSGGICRCTGTLVFSTLLGAAVREVNVEGEVQCTAEALGASSSMDPRVCWCQSGVAWGDDVRSGLAAIVRQGLTPRVEIASEEAAGDLGCEPEADGLWYGCVTMSRRWDATVVPQVMMRTAPPEEQLDMSLKKLDACHRLAPKAALRVVGVRSGQSADAVTMPVSAAGVCSVVYEPDDGATWTAKTSVLHCATQPGTCTTTPCECRKATDNKISLHTPQGQKCWACAEPGKEYMFRVNALAEEMEGGSVSWWPPYGINCPPILWAFMDWRMVMSDCPAVSCIFGLFVFCLLLRKFEELSGGLLPWTRVAPLFGPPLRRGEVWRFVTYTYFHLQFFDLFQNVLTMLDTLDVEGTPAIILGDGSNLKCGVGAKPNFMCYPSIGIGSYHTFGVAIVSAAVGGMCSTWITFKAVVTGASCLGFGLSGAVVGLYGLYAGAELDQATSVQRSFQDWVHLRLIFVAFHIAMEWVRSISQRDATGLIAHTASFVAGFMYVLYFLPPMGDGTMFPSGRPYVVPCAYDVYGSGMAADGSVPECIRLFSQIYEYEVSDVQFKAFMMFAGTILLTLVNIVYLQRRVSPLEGAEIGNREVSAVLCLPKNARPRSQAYREEGDSVYIWAEVMKVSKLQAADDIVPAVEVRIIPAAAGGDPRKLKGGGFGADETELKPEVVACTKPVEGGGSDPEFKESLFLNTLYSKSSYLQLVLYDTRPDKRVPIGFAALTLPQACRYDAEIVIKEQQLALQEIDGSGQGRARLHVRLRSMYPDALRILKMRIQNEIEKGNQSLIQMNALLVNLQDRAAAAQAEA